MKRSHEPVFWALFGAGGMLSALLGPALVLVTGLALPLGWLPAEALSPARVLALQLLHHSAHAWGAAQQHGEEQLALLPVVALLRELVHVEQHGAQHGKVGQPLIAPRLREQHGQ